MEEMCACYEHCGRSQDRLANANRMMTQVLIIFQKILEQFLEEPREYHAYGGIRIDKKRHDVGVEGKPMSDVEDGQLVRCANVRSLEEKATAADNPITANTLIQIRRTEKDEF